MTHLTPREVAEALSWREFSAVCRYFDLIALEGKKSTVSKQSWGHTQFSQEATIKPQTISQKFDVFHVEREEKLMITCMGEDGVLRELDATAFRWDRVGIHGVAA